MDTSSETGLTEEGPESDKMTGGNRHGSLSSGLIIDDYVLDRELSCSEDSGDQRRSVWVATDSVRDRPVVLKLERSDGGKQNQRLQHEFDQLRQLAHEQLPEVFAAGLDSELGWAFIAMEFVDGVTLDVALDQLGGEHFADLLWQACHVLTFFHEGHGVVHGDVKPENIVVITSGTTPRLKLIDLGLAGPSGSGAEGVVRGTRFFAAASILRGEAPTEQSDLYALGVSFVVALTGQRDGLSLLEAKLIPALGRVVNRMVREDEDARYSAIREVSGDLLPLVSEELRLKIGDSLRPRFVGRQTELSWFERWTRGLKRMHMNSRIVILRGESGIGKSRLLEEVSALAVTNGLVVLHGIASPRSEGVYRQLVGLLDAASMKFDDFGAATEINELRSRLEFAGRQTSRGVLDASADAGLWMDLLALFARIASGRSLLIVLDDLALSNATIIDFLAFAARDPNPCPIGYLVALTDDKSTQDSRSGIENPLLDRYVAESLFRESTLDRLSETESFELVNSILGPKFLGTELCWRIAKATAGHPQFCAFSANSVVRESARRQVDVQELLSREQPDSLADALSRKLGNLSTTERGGVDCLSIFERKIPNGVVQAVLLEAGTVRVEELVQLGVLTKNDEQVERILPPNESFEFSSEAFRRMVIESLSIDDRECFHSRAYEAWLSEIPSGARSFELTEHALGAGDVQLALENAPEALDYLLANRFFRAAIDLAENVLAPSSLENRAKQIRRVFERLGDAYRAAGELPKSREAYDRSLEEAKSDHFIARLLRKRAFVLDALGDSDRATTDLRLVYEQREQLDVQERVAVCVYLGKVEFRRGRVHAAEDWLRRGLEDIEDPENDSIGSSLWLNWGNLELGRNRQVEARQYLERAIKLNMEGGDLVLRGRGLGSLGVLAMIFGQLAEARSALSESLEIKRRVGDRRLTAVTLSNLGQLDHWVGSYGPALRKFEEALAIRVEVADLNGEIMTRAHLAEVWHDKGDFREALTQARQAVAKSEKRADEARFNALRSVSTVLLTLGLFDEAEHFAVEGLALARKCEAIGDEALLLTILGEIEHSRDPETQKLSAHLEDALTVVREIDYPRVLASVLVSQAECLLKVSNVERATEVALEALALSEKLDLRLFVNKSELVLGCIAVKRGLIDEASRRLHRAEELAIFLAVPEMTWKVHFALGVFHREGGRNHRALKWLDKSLNGLSLIVDGLDDDELENSYLDVPERASKLVSIEAWMGKTGN
ncbi:MAG: tetratricopeptide (TPR) repeat protein [Planctomycetota bacterium]|jgi:tetratricopeptide (TPR) repeat protein/aminoglycoside phosphotransferase (APT) family kinase protein